MAEHEKTTLLTKTVASPSGSGNVLEYDTSEPPHSYARRFRDWWCAAPYCFVKSPLLWIFLATSVVLALWLDTFVTDYWRGGDGRHNEYVSFPPDFAWGAATSAYQVEGAATADGRGPSIWDTWCADDPANCHGDNGAVADDHYHRMEADVRLMKELGLKAYRFSVAWPRILPAGRGEVNPKGVAFYDRLIDALLEAGIEPWVTLYHWDLPQALYDEYGGWENRAVIEDFGAYARVCFDAFGDRVKHWITINESWTVAVHGHDEGTNAPGKTIQTGREPYEVAHVLILAHARAARIYKRDFATAQGGVIGISNCGDFRYPANPSSKADRRAADRAMEFQLGWFADPIWKGEYPTSMRERLGDRLPRFTPEERLEVAGSADFFGLNHYSSLLAAEPAEEQTYREYWADMHVDFSSRDEWDANCLGWPVVPDGCGALLRWIDERYDRPAIVMTENGSCEDEPDLETALRDEGRRSYFEGYIRSAGEAVESGGVDLRGYFAWSLLDNFEWQYGYSKRFGICYVDYDTQERTPKSSATWYRETIQANGGNILKQGY